VPAELVPAKAGSKYRNDRKYSSLTPMFFVNENAIVCVLINEREKL